MGLVPGHIAMILLANGLILLITGWLSFLYRDLPVSRTAILVWGGLFLLAAGSPPIVVTPHIWVQPAFVLGVGMMVRLAPYVERKKRWLLLSGSMSASAFLFMAHEFLLVHTHWDDSGFRALVLLTVWSVSLCAVNRWMEQWVFALAILFLLHGFILFFHREMLNPLYIGAPDVLDTIWLALSGIILFQAMVRMAEDWQKRRGTLIR